jgi:hypothetical protein
MSELSHAAGQIISYIEMCQAWSVNLQKGMNFRLRPDRSVVLMSRRLNAPYRDRIENEGRVLIYEGHDVPRTKNNPDPKIVDQLRVTPSGKLTQNGLFENAALKAKNDKTKSEIISVYEKIHTGIWAYNGLFMLTDAWLEPDEKRMVFKFRLELSDVVELVSQTALPIEHTRLIPSAVKLEVWKRDHGCCVLCQEKDHLHFDHDLPFSKGGSSMTAKNIRLLCARHNLTKSDKIE